MGVPDVNPVSAGWLPRGGTYDHLGSTEITCAACGSMQRAERYRVLVGGGGFGAPFFVAPFLKKRSTAGKIGGTRGVFAQCTGCGSMWPEDDGARAVLVKSGQTDGALVSAHVYFDWKNRVASAREATETAATDPTSSRVKKSPGTP